MPYGDRTGPMGQGPMTGRRAGYCTGGNMPGYASRGRVSQRGGRGGGRQGRGFGGGGNRYGFHAFNQPEPVMPPQVPGPVPEEPPDRTRQIQILQEQAEFLKSTLSDVRRQLDRLAAETPSEPRETDPDRS